MILLKIIFILLTGAFVTYNLYCALKIRNSIRFLKRYGSLKHSKLPEELPSVIIVIPVLNEEKEIEKTVKHMLSLNYPKNKFNILIVTTEKEKLLQKDYDTIDIAKELASKYDLVKWLHYPYQKGCKSDQLNFAISQFSRTFPEKEAKDTFFAIYDADSLPNRDTLKIFSLFSIQNKTANVFQQSALFFKNFSELNKKSWISRSFLQAAAISQTKFTLACEIPRLLRKCRDKYFIDKTTYAHCVGHGLFIRVSFLGKVKFPANYYPEDMFYGFILNAIKEKVIPLPVLDCSDVPNTIRGEFKQKMYWFYGPFRGWTYLKYVQIHFSHIYSKNSLRIILIAASSLLTALRWLMKSFLIIFLLVITIIFGKSYSFLFIIAILSYLLTIYQITINYTTLWNSAGAKKNSLKTLKQIQLSLFSVIYLSFESFPAYYGTIRLFLKRIKVNCSETKR